MRSRASGWLGLGLFLAGVGLIAGLHLWHATRTFVPLDIPVSLSRGRIQTGEFVVNYEAFYRVTIESESLRAIRLRGASTPLGNSLGDEMDQPSATELQITQARSLRIQARLLPGWLRALNPGRYELDCRRSQ